jgi:hypothetical protein
MTSLSLWGNIAAIVLIVEIAVVVTTAGVVIFLGYKGVHFLISQIPVYARRVHGYLQIAKKWVTRVCRWIALPFVTARSAWAGIRRTWQTIRGA